jgi:hypothetical protein
MTFIQFDEELTINLERVCAVKIRPNRYDGSYRNNADYPFIADIFVAGHGKPFTVHLSEYRAKALREHLQAKPLDGRR